MYVLFHNHLLLLRGQGIKVNSLMTKGFCNANDIAYTNITSI